MKEYHCVPELHKKQHATSNVWYWQEYITSRKKMDTCNIRIRIQWSATLIVVFEVVLQYQLKSFCINTHTLKSCFPILILLNFAGVHFPHMSTLYATLLSLFNWSLNLYFPRLLEIAWYGRNYLTIRKCSISLVICTNASHQPINNHNYLSSERRTVMHKIFSNILVGNTPSVLSTNVFYLDNIGSI